MSQAHHDNIQTIGVDWSGAHSQTTQRGAIWVAVVRQGQLVELSSGRTRDETMAHVLRVAAEHPRTVIGLDFAFSFPRWYLEEREIGQARQLWEWARAQEDEAQQADVEGGWGWPAALPAPFWGPHVRPLPDALRGRDRFRRTEMASKRPGASPQSPFQLTGAGSVGAQSLRGMAQLARLEQASVWPFDPPGWPLVVEVFPRLFVRELRPDLIALSGGELVEELVESSPESTWGGRGDWHDTLLESQDAVDAVASAWGLWATRSALASLPDEREHTYLLEGRIFSIELARHYLDGAPIPSPLSASPINAESGQGRVDALARALESDTDFSLADRQLLLGVYELLREQGSGASRHAPRHRAQGPGSEAAIRIEGERRRFQAHWVADDLMLSNLPFEAGHVEAMAAQGVRSVLNMVEDSEYRGEQRAILDASYAAAGIVEHRLRQPDGSALSTEVVQLGVDLFHGAHRRGPVAVHCLGGKERSATVAAAIRTELTGESPLEAVDAIEGITGSASPLPHQMRVLEVWYSLQG